MLRLFILTLFLTANQSWAMPLDCDSLLFENSRQIKVENYQGALNTCQKLMGQFPEHPVGYFCAAGVYQTVMRNYRTTIFEAEFDSLIHLAIHHGEQLHRQKPDNAFSKLYLGKAYAYRGLHQSRKGNFISALNDGSKGMGLIKDALALNSALYDAYCWLGTFHYWRAAKGRIAGLLFGKGRTRGMKEIQHAIKNSPFVAIDGKYALVAIYYHEQAYDQALKVNQELYEQYPTNPSCLYMRSRIFEKMGRWKKATQAMEQLIQHIQQSPYRSPGYEAECLYRLALYDYQFGKHKRSHAFLQRAFVRLRQRNASRELEGPLDQVDQILNDMEALQTALQKTACSPPQKKAG